MTMIVAVPEEVTINPTQQEMDTLLTTVRSQKRSPVTSATLSAETIAEIEQIYQEASTYPSESELRPEQIEQMMTDAENHANGVHAPQGSPKSRFRGLLTHLYLGFKQNRPSLQATYVQMPENERVRAKNQIFDRENLQKEGFTKTEVDAMLRRFLLLDRLVMSPEQVKAEQRRLANLAYNAPLSADAQAEMRDGIKRDSVALAERQGKYNARMRRLGQEVTRQHSAKKLDTAKLEKYVRNEFAQALKKRNDRSARTAIGINYRSAFGTVPQLGEAENPFAKLTDRNQIAKLLIAHGATRTDVSRIGGRITRKMQFTLGENLQRADKGRDLLGNPRVKGSKDHTSAQRYGQKVSKELERVL